MSFIPGAGGIGFVALNRLAGTIEGAGPNRPLTAEDGATLAIGIFPGGSDIVGLSKAAKTLPEGYSSFSAAKRAMGSPGQGNVFDHVVEQSQIRRSGFAPEDIHNPFNMNPVSARSNQIKANYCSSKQPFTGGKTVRDWLTGQSFCLSILVRNGRPGPNTKGDHQMTTAGGGITDVLLEFAETAVTWNSLVATNARQANPVFDRAHTLAKSLRTTPEGRAGVEAITRHALAGVRLLAATECLAWAPEIGIPVLEELEHSSTLHAVSAKYTLKGYRSGTLDLDW